MRQRNPVVILPAVVAAAALVTLGCSSAPAAGVAPRVHPATFVGSRSAGQVSARPASGGPPRLDHVVIVMFENKEAGSIIGSPYAPYFNTLAKHGADMTESYAVTHPSQPNYVALFSGSTQGLTGDSCPHTFKTNNEANELIKAGFTFTSYAEDLPAAGSKVCLSGEYARKHAPWTNFPNVPDSAQQPYTSFPTDYTQLPDVSWVIPNLCDDMHDCSIATGDSWLKSNLGDYASWAKANNSLLIVTFDEDDSAGDNRIATIFYGAHVKTGEYDQHITHYSVLRTIEDMYGVARLGYAATTPPVHGIWS